MLIAIIKIYEQTYLLMNLNIYPGVYLFTHEKLFKKIRK